MDVRIGIIQAPRELVFETKSTAEELIEILEAARTEEGKLAVFTDVKGAQLLVNPTAIAYMEMGEKAAGRVGFVS